MSGYQSLHDLIAQQIGGFVTPTEITTLTDTIHNEWLPNEIEAVNETARLAKKNAERERVRADSIAASAQAPNLREQDLNGFTGGF